MFQNSLSLNACGKTPIDADRMEKIFEGQSGYNSEYIEILKRIMLTDEDDTQIIYGKTGSGGLNSRKRRM